MRRSSDDREPERRASGSAGDEPLAATPGKRVDAGGPDSLHFSPPVADWIEFLAELLAAELLRERAGGGSGQ
jgi:hypothetical protein